MMLIKKIRSRQDSNLRSHRESDFESDALTTRPQLHSYMLYTVKMIFIKSNASIICVLFEHNANISWLVFLCMMCT